MRNLFLVAFVVCCSCFSVLHAQERKSTITQSKISNSSRPCIIQGIVVDQVGKGVSSIIKINGVFIFNKPESGSFTITVDPGTYIIQFLQMGFHSTKPLTVKIDKGEIYTLNVTLQPTTTVN